MKERAFIPRMLPTSALVTTAANMWAGESLSAVSCTLVLLAGKDLDSMTAKTEAVKAEGVVVVTAYSVREAVDSFKSGDFDIVVLDDSLPETERNRLTCLIRASGSRTPVVSLSGEEGHKDTFADATIHAEPLKIVAGLADVLRGVRGRRVDPLRLAPGRTESLKKAPGEWPS